MQFSQQILFLTLHYLSFLLKAGGFIFTISSSHSLLMFPHPPNDRHLILHFFAVKFLNYKGVSAKTQECIELGL